ncbi:hypothetical protein RCL_jg16214.t1 [Rhizophagus clarus]|uniref:Uncharacterized protein n=1 Tax=Rhizophagus clarus TaxID=94130 RepID=A0A8H3R851_9GLOM|nr:hypothetical protein RCL_jg16214.t1 [Rhizophagus clarus]
MITYRHKVTVLTTEKYVILRVENVFLSSNGVISFLFFHFGSFWLREVSFLNFAVFNCSKNLVTIRITVWFETAQRSGLRFSLNDGEEGKGEPGKGEFPNKQDQDQEVNYYYLNQDYAFAMGFQYEFSDWDQAVACSM